MESRIACLIKLFALFMIFTQFSYHSPCFFTGWFGASKVETASSAPPLPGSVVVKMQSYIGIMDFFACDTSSVTICMLHDFTRHLNMHNSLDPDQWSTKGKKHHHIACIVESICRYILLI